MENNVYIYIIIMALTTFMIRVLPLTLIRKEIKNEIIRSFLYYVPYAVLSAMTFPAIFSSTGTYPSAVAGCAAAVILAYFRKGLLTVAVGAAAAVFAVQMLGF